MKVMIDTNVAMDFLSDRMPFSDDAEKVFTFCCSELVDGYMTVNSFCDLYYILSRFIRDAQELESVLGFWLKFVRIIDTHSADCMNAFSSGIPDFEDAVIAQVAERNSMDYIVTRNTADFEGSAVPAITPSDFIKVAVKY